MRKRIGLAAGFATALVPLALFTSVAFSERGLSGTIDERVDQLTSTDTAAPTEGAGRITEASSTRGKYWGEAEQVFSDRPAIGTGAGTFGNSRLRYRTDEGVSRHAHGFVAQTIADTGLAGLLASLALLAAWLAAALRTTGLLPRFRRFGVAFRRRDWDTERIALVGLLLVAVVFGLQSVIDWTWFVPGPAAMALMAAGFVAGRGPVGALAGAPAVGVPAPPRKHRMLRPLNEPGRLALASAVAACALLFAWAIWQPEASDRASNQALALAEGRDYQDALARADDAARANPLTPKPLFVRAAAQTQAGDLKGARVSLEHAVLKFPGDPQTWFRLASFQLGTPRPAGRGAADTRGRALPRPALKGGARALVPGAQPAAGEEPRAARLAAGEREQRSRPRPQRLDLEAQLAEQPAQRARGEEAQVRRERVEAALEAAHQQPGRGAPPVGGCSHGEHPAGDQHAPRLRQQQLDVAHVLERLRAQHEVEARVVERQGRVGLELGQRRVRQPRARAAQGLGGHVGRCQLARPELLGQPPVAAAEVEHPPAGIERGDERAQVRRRRAGILGDQLPQLVVVAARHLSPARGRSA